MFLRKTPRKKDGKTHDYWSVVENKRVAGGRVVQRHVLSLGRSTPRRQRSGARPSRSSMMTRDIRGHSRCSPKIALRRHRARQVGRPTSPVGHTAMPAAPMGRLLARRAVVAGVGTRPVLGRPAFPRAAKARVGIRSCRCWSCTRLIAPGSEWKLRRGWFGKSAMADLLEADFKIGRGAQALRLP